MPRTDEHQDRSIGEQRSKLTAQLRESREEDLHDGLTSLAALVTGALPLAHLLERVAQSAVQAIPRADGTGVTLLRLNQSVDRVQTLAASAPFVAEIDAIQYELLDEGPCITAAEERAVVRTGSLGEDPRWPRFGPRVASLGIQSVLCLPMLLSDDTVVGALNAFSREHEAFDEHAARLGELFAGPAGVAVYNAQVLAQAQTQAAQLQAALSSRAQIDQAVGLVRGRTGASTEEAYARLRKISQDENVSLSVVAERLVAEAVRRAQARRASS